MASADDRGLWMKATYVSRMTPKPTTGLKGQVRSSKGENAKIIRTPASPLVTVVRQIVAPASQGFPGLLLSRTYPYLINRLPVYSPSA